MHSFFFHKISRSASFRSIKILFLFLLISSLSFSQEKKRIEILHSGYGESDEKLAANAQRLVDSVLIRHKEILLWCDTAYIYAGTNKVDAVGNVHIKQGDTLHLYANNIFYNGDISFARAWGNVILKNKGTTLYSDTLDYDMENNICYYNDSGKIVDSTTTITSTIGKYFLDENNIYFYKNVKGNNEDFTLKSDTVLYNTETGKLFIDGPSTVRDSVNTLYTENGWYDSNTGEAELKEKSFILGKTQQLNAKYIKYNKENGTGKAFGSVKMHDTENRSIILGNIAEYNEKEETAMVTDSAVYITYSKNDSLYLHADTLRTMPDTTNGEKIVSAYYGVRFFRADTQGVCDSLVYFTRDSVIQLYKNPVIWSDIHQLSADVIEMKQIANAPDELHLTNNSFIIAKQDSGQFDQIKGKEMVGYIVDQKIRNIDVNGNGQTLYYAKEKEEIIGLNRAESSKITIRFLDGAIHQIAFLKQPEGELKPLLGLSEEDKHLSGFDWKIKLRPLSKFDIFPRPEILFEEKSDSSDINMDKKIRNLEILK